MKNKISDDGLCILLRALAQNQKVSSLNLNINLLSEKSLPLFVELAKINKTLKKIYLKSNNVSSRAARGIVADLQKLGVKLDV